jgi:signal transduction histidine kinase
VPTLLRADSIQNSAGRQIGLITAHTDISDQKRAETFQREQSAFQKALRDSAAALAATLELDEVLDRILINIGRVVPHDMAQVLLIEEGIARIVRLRGFNQAGTRAWLWSQRYNVTEQAELRRMIENGEPIVEAEAVTDWNDTYPFELRKIRSYISVPIRLKSRTVGFLYLYSKEPEFFVSVHVDRLQMFAEHAAIAIQNAQLFEKAQQLAALQERQRLARNLHDAVSQTLYSASVIAEALPLLLERDSEKVKPRLAQLHRLTRGALAEMRTLLLELRPSTLREADLADLLHQLTEALQGRTQLEVNLVIQCNCDLSEDVKTALFYIAQEALNNVVKHAGATRVNVSLIKQSDKLELRVIDDGQGFDPTEINSTSMGMGIMRERAETIGAYLSITSKVDQGTSVVVTRMDIA